MSKILVTGATGRLGANVVRALLERGDEVRCLVMPNDPAAKKLDRLDVEIVEADLRDTERLQEAVRGVDKVAHFAAIMDVRPAGMSLVEYFDINTRASFALADAAQANGVEKFLYTSTTAVYDTGTLTVVPTPEDVELRPNADYGVTKVASEAALMALAYRYDLPTIIHRPSYIMACDQVLVFGKPGPVIGSLKAAATDPHSATYTPDLGEPWKDLEEKARANPDLSLIPYGPAAQPLSAVAASRGSTGSPRPELVEGRSCGSPGRDSRQVSRARQAELVPWQWHVTDVRDCVQAALLSLDNTTIERDIFTIAGPPPANFEEVVTYKCSKLGTPYEEVHTAVTWRLDFDISKARELLGYSPEYDVFRMIDDAIAFRNGEDIGVIPA